MAQPAHATVGNFKGEFTGLETHISSVTCAIRAGK